MSTAAVRSYSVYGTFVSAINFEVDLKMAPQAITSWDNFTNFILDFSWPFNGASFHHVAPLGGKFEDGKTIYLPVVAHIVAELDVMT